MLVSLSRSCDLKELTRKLTEVLTVIDLVQISRDTSHSLLFRSIIPFLSACSSTGLSEFADHDYREWYNISQVAVESNVG